MIDWRIYGVVIAAVMLCLPAHAIVITGSFAGHATGTFFPSPQIPGGSTFTDERVSGMFQFETDPSPDEAVEVFGEDSRSIFYTEPSSEVRIAVDILGTRIETPVDGFPTVFITAASGSGSANDVLIFGSTLGFQGAIAVSIFGGFDLFRGFDLKTLDAAAIELSTLSITAPDFIQASVVFDELKLDIPVAATINEPGSLLLLIGVLGLACGFRSCR
jgi:hypothetical protein